MRVPRPVTTGMTLRFSALGQILAHTATHKVQPRRAIQDANMYFHKRQMQLLPSFATVKKASVPAPGSGQSVTCPPM